MDTFARTVTNIMNGLVSLQGIETDLETVDFVTPEVIRGKAESESESFFGEDNVYSRDQYRGNHTPLLDSARTREFLDADE